MLSKRPHLMIRKLSEFLVPGNRQAIPQEIPAAATPRSPLDVKFPSTGNSKRYDIGGVGLGIVAALEKSSSRGIKRHEVLAKYPVPSRSDPNRSDPVRCPAGKFRGLEMDISNSEDYTYVTRRDGPTRCVITKVYYDDGVKFCNDLCDVVDDDGGMGFGRRWRKPVDVSDEPPAAASTELFGDSSGFLSSCSLCKKKLHGKDIYMYKGEKGFCSEECRSVEIMNDERKEQCRPEVSVSRSPYDAGEQIFSAGIFVF